MYIISLIVESYYENIHLNIHLFIVIKNENETCEIIRFSRKNYTVII